MVVVVLVLLVAAVLGWFALRDRITDEGEQAAKACVEGDAVLAVTADPDIADAVRTVAAAWDATAPVVRDHCVTTTVTETASDVAAAALAADPSDAAAGPRPSLWIPATSADAAPLIDARRVDSTPRSLATSPVVLGVAPTLADTLGAAAVGWADLPRLAATPGRSTPSAPWAGDPCDRHCRRGRPPPRLWCRWLRRSSIPPPPPRR